MRFILGVAIIIIIFLAGLLIYGQMLGPETRTIEVDVELTESDR